jgi:hypothetical protein
VLPVITEAAPSREQLARIGVVGPGASEWKIL